MIRGSLRFVSWKNRKAVVADLKGVYQAASEELAQENLEIFARKWDGRLRWSGFFRQPGAGYKW
jgi:transposase-like protein